MAHYAPINPAFESDDIFAHWRDEDARIREEEASALRREFAYQAAIDGNLTAVMEAWDTGYIDDDTASLALYGCNCRRCRKSDPAGCVSDWEWRTA